MESRIVVVGGGIAGLGAALEIARRGLGVTIVEASETLGGNALGWACMATAGCARCGVCLVHDALGEAERSPAISRRLGWRVGRSLGEGSALTLTISHGQGGHEELRDIAGVVLALGFEPHDPAQGRPQGASGHPAVVTSVAMNTALRTGRLDAFAFGAAYRARLALLHCVGSRDPEAGRPYCSQICCGTAIRMARRLKHLRPGWDITLFYNDLQVFGKEARLADLGELRLVQGIPAEIRAPWDPQADQASAAGTGSREALPPDTPRGGLELTFQGTGGHVRSEGFDGAVLLVGLTPRQGSGPLGASLGFTGGTGGFLAGSTGGDPRVVAAGACLAPMGIEASLLSGRAAAARLLSVLSPRPPARLAVTRPHTADREAIERPATREADPPPIKGDAQGTPRLPVVVVGAGAEAREVLEALGKAGLPCLWVNPAPAPRDETASDETLLSAESILRLDGALGDFSLVVRTDQGRRAVRCGAVVLLGELPWEAPAAHLGELPVRAVDRLAPEAGTPPGRELVLWLDPAGPPHRGVAATLLREAAELQASGAARVTLLGDHVPLPGLEAQEWYDRARRAGMRVLRTGGKPPRLRRQEGALALGLVDARVPEVPVALPTEALLEPARPIPPRALASGLGLRLDREGFAPVANVRLAPLRSERAGLYVLGSARQETLPEERAEQARALAAELAILVGEGAPASREAPVEIDTGRCVQCFTCVRGCPHRAIEEQPRGAPRIWAQACEACGRCVALCPALAIRAPGAQLGPRTTLRSAWDDAVRAGAPGRPPPEPTAPNETSRGASDLRVVFACGRSGAPCLRAARAEGGLGGLGLVIREVPCLGAVSDLEVLEALYRGAPQVLLVGCHAGSCGHVNGSELCTGRVAWLRQRLADLGASPHRVALLTCSPAEPARLGRAIGELCSQGDPA